MGEAFIVSAARTAGGRRGGRLAGMHPVDLGAAVVDALLHRADADPTLVEDVFIMLDAPADATSRALGRAAMTIEQIDLFEVNEAFAPLPLAWLRNTRADADKMNVHGGAIALGHPLGASGTKLIATLLNALKLRRGRFGLLTMCEGGGMANATIIERF
jgi:acetyl-CoA acetyltransferase